MPADKAQAMHDAAVQSSAEDYEITDDGPHGVALTVDEVSPSVSPDTPVEAP